MTISWILMAVRQMRPAPWRLCLRVTRTAVRRLLREFNVNVHVVAAGYIGHSRYMVEALLCYRPRSCLMDWPLSITETWNCSTMNILMQSNLDTPGWDETDSSMLCRTRNAPSGESAWRFSETVVLTCGPWFSIAKLVAPEPPQHFWNFPGERNRHVDSFLSSRALPILCEKKKRRKKGKEKSSSEVSQPR